MIRGINKRFSFSIWIIVLYILIIPLLNIRCQMYSREEGVIIWDIKSYYAYLPAAIIEKDLTLSFMEEKPGTYNKWIWPITTPTGNRAILTTMGLSVMYSPFFFLGHGYALISEKYEANGYTKPYHFALTFSVYIYFILGLFILRKLLLKHFTDFAVGLTLIAVGAGTNLIHYITIEAPMSHGFNFFLIILFLYLLSKWREKPSIKNTVLIGLTTGLISLIRPTNTLVVLLVPLYGAYSFIKLKDNAIFLLRNWPKLILFGLMVLLVWVPQFLYWKKVAGTFFYFSYGEVDSSFFFGNPQILNILFSIRKGWFVYTPIMFLATIGMYYLARLKNPYSFGVILYFILNLYILSSWWSWWFGGGFSNRAFVDSYGIMAIPLAAFTDHFRKKKVGKWIVVVLILLLTAYNIFQSQQYRKGSIHWFWMNGEAYRESFLKLHPSCKYWHILDQPDVEKARRGIYEAMPFTDSKITREDLYDYIRTKSAEDSLYADQIEKEVMRAKGNIKEAASDIITQYIDLGLADEEYRQLRIKLIVSDMYRCKSWKKEIAKKAKRRGLSFEEAAQLEAARIFEKYSQKYLQ